MIIPSRNAFLEMSGGLDCFLVQQKTKNNIAILCGPANDSQA